MSFLLEGPDLGHGMLSYEAMLAKVPLVGIDKNNYSGAFKNRLIMDNLTELKRKLLPKNLIDLLNQTELLCKDSS